MKLKYDVEVDILRITLVDSPITESGEDKPGIIFDYDKNGSVVGIEILDASKRISNPKVVEYEVQ